MNGISRCMVLLFFHGLPIRMQALFSMQVFLLGFIGKLYMYSGGFYHFATPEEHWAYWSRYIFINRYQDAPSRSRAGIIALLLDIYAKAVGFGGRIHL